MNDLDRQLQAAIAIIPECIASGYMDLASGRVLGYKTVDSRPSYMFELLASTTAGLFQNSNELLAAITADLLEGPGILSIDQRFRAARGLPESSQRHYFQEVIVNSEDLIHVLLRGKRQAQVACFVCHKSANLDAVLAKAHLAMQGIEASL